MLILVINPGSTSDKIAVYRNREALFTHKVNYTSEQLAAYPDILSQLPLRRQAILDALSANKVNREELATVVGRGGPLKPLEGGIYAVNAGMVAEILAGKVQAHHPANLGALLAFEIAEPLSIPSYIVDPVSTDDILPLARITGHPDLQKKSLTHALNAKAAARKAAHELGMSFEEADLVVAHLGGGISVNAISKGRIVDVATSRGTGPFAPDSCGLLPMPEFAELAMSGKHTFKEVYKWFFGQGGLILHLGTSDSMEVLKRIEAGDEKALRIFQAMAYQISLSIGSMAVALCGKIDGIVLTGGLANSALFVEWIREFVSFLGPIVLIPGEEELDALAWGAFRAMRKEEKVKEYPVDQ